MAGAEKETTRPRPRFPFLRMRYLLLLLLTTTRDAALLVLLLLLLLATEKREHEEEEEVAGEARAAVVVARIGLVFGAGIAALSKPFMPIAAREAIENAMMVAEKVFSERLREGA